MSGIRKALPVAAVVIFAFGTTGCDDGPECLESHTTVTLQPVFNGKTTTMQPVVSVVCDRYAKK